MATVTLWLTTTAADDYFATRYNSADYWASGVDKEGVLTLAQSQLQASGKFTFPDTATDAMKEAVCEQALFILQNPDMEQRLALIAQGVSTARMVQEGYARAKDNLVVAPLAIGLLKSIVAAKSFDISK